MDVLNGAERTIGRLHPPILIELNPWSANAAGRSTREIIDRLGALGYSSLATVESFPTSVDVQEIALTQQTNIVATT